VNIIFLYIHYSFLMTHQLLNWKEISFFPFKTTGGLFIDLNLFSIFPVCVISIKVQGSFVCIIALSTHWNHAKHLKSSVLDPHFQLRSSLIVIKNAINPIFSSILSIFLFVCIILCPHSYRNAVFLFPVVQKQLWKLVKEHMERLLRLGTMYVK